MKVFDGLYAFVWHNYRENNCNTYLINGDKKFSLTPVISISLVAMLQIN